MGILASRCRAMASWSMLLVLLLMMAPSTVMAQDDVKGATPLARAKNLVAIGDYRNAQVEFDALLEASPEDMFLNYMAGVCRLRQNINKASSIRFLRKVVNMPSFDQEALYDLGLAFMVTDQVDSALIFFNKYLLVVKDPVRKVDVTRQIEFCGNAKYYMKSPVNVRFENLGKGVNSEGPDLNPMVPLDQSFLLFTTKRDKGVMGNNLDFDGYKPPDIFMSQSKNGEFQRAKSASPLINSVWVEELAGISAFGEHMFIMMDNLESSEDIWGSVFSGRNWSKPLPLGGIFTGDMSIQAASCTPDGQTIYFSIRVDDESGFGGFDIFKSKKLPNGDWGTPENLGPTVNTQYNENYPLISFDEKTLYFCSEGHRSMGGYDIYRSEWNEKMERWERPVNLGYPINNTMDNLVFSPTEDPKVGYTAQLRPEGLGDLDIYRVVFGDVEQRMSTVVINLDVMTGPEKEFIHVHEWKSADGQIKWFPVQIGYQPTDKEGYTFVETKKMEVKDGEAYEFTIIGAANGGEVSKYDEKTFPKGATFDLVDMRVKKNKVNPKGVNPTVRPLKGQNDIAVTATVTDANGNHIGDYLPNYNTGRLVMVLAPGMIYDITVEADGFQSIKEKLNVMDLGDFRELIPRTYMLVENGLPKP